MIWRRGTIPNGQIAYARREKVVCLNRHPPVPSDKLYPQRHTTVPCLLWDVDVGESYEMSYQSICNGRNPAFFGDRIDTSIWDGFIIFTNGDYKNTILPNLP